MYLDFLNTNPFYQPMRNAMMRLSIVLTFAAGLIFSACSHKTPEFINSIPDDAIAVVSLHPMQLYTKSRINTLETIKEKIKNEAWKAILENPLSTGLMMDEYAYVFLTLEETGPMIGIISGMKNEDKFISTLDRIKEDISQRSESRNNYTFYQADSQGIVGWNESRMILLFSPDSETFAPDFFTGSLDRLFNPIKEESITSLVDFKDFLEKMKDLNLWASSDKMMDLIKKRAGDKVPEIPFTLYNNYAQVFVDFSSGEMNITGETHFSEEVEKLVQEIFVLNPSLNEEMLHLTPGGNLLLAIAGSMDLEKAKRLAKKYAPPKLDSIGTKVEMLAGMEIEDLIKVFTGDFTIAVNAVDEEVMIPVELFIGLGVNSRVMLEKLKETVQSMVPVDDHIDFFIVNIQGTEIYSGIINDMLVITNTGGYKDDVKDGHYHKPLSESGFSSFADGSLGIWLNLDQDSYPIMIKNLLDQESGQNKWIERITDPFDYLGISASHYRNHVTLKTNQPSENSLYTILKLIETPDQ